MKMEIVGDHSEELIDKVDMIFERLERSIDKAKNSIETLN